MTLTLVPEAIESYAQAHTSPVPEIYERLREETYRDHAWPQMQVGPLEGRFLKLVARMIQARSAVEVGTYTGYSALSIAEGMAEDGRLVTCDVDEKTNAVARRYFAEAPWGRKIEARLGPAKETLATLEGPFDLAFLDADKESYVDYWEAIVPKLRPGGVLLADNVLWGGRVLAPEHPSDHAIVRFNDHALRDRRTELVMTTVRDGVTMAVKR